MVNIPDYGLLYEDESKDNPNPSQMPIHNPQQYDDKGIIWVPSERWIYDMPVIGTPKQDSLDQKKNK